VEVAYLRHFVEVVLVDPVRVHELLLHPPDVAAYALGRGVPGGLALLAHPRRRLCVRRIWSQFADRLPRLGVLGILGMPNLPSLPGLLRARREPALVPWLRR